MDVKFSRTADIRDAMVHLCICFQWHIFLVNPEIKMDLKNFGSFTIKILKNFKVFLIIWAINKLINENVVTAEMLLFFILWSVDQKLAAN